MKLAVLWLVAAVTAALVIGSCSIHHRSSDFACDTSADCAFGRICSDGVCVSTLPIDAGPRDAGSLCPAQCTTCDVGQRACLIDCAAGNTGVCNNRVTCPEGWNCKIVCNDASTCRNGVDCSDAASCDIACIGTESCRNIDCGTGTCNVDCIGTDSCQQIDCENSCACDVTCSDASRCQAVTCKDLRCFDVFGDGCTSKDDRSCDTCM